MQFQIAKALTLKEYYEVDNSITERRGRLQLPAEGKEEKTFSSFQLYHNLILIVGCLVIYLKKKC